MSTPPDAQDRLHVTLRLLTAEDFDDVVALQRVCFPTMATWVKRNWLLQIETFPEGQFAIEINGELAATASGLIVDLSDYDDWHDWNTVSGHGSFSTHDAEGDTFYGVEMQVHPRYRGMRLSRRLYEARKALCRKMNIARILIGGRIPGYAQRADEMTAQEYVSAVIDKRFHDPVLTSQLSNGFSLKAIIPDYLDSDEDSAGYATFLEWINLDYHRPKTRRIRRSVEPVRVGTVQWQMRRIRTFEDFAQQCEFFVDTASDYRTDFLLFPELFTAQLLCLVPPGRPEAGARALAEYTPRFIELFSHFAVRYNVNIIGGSTLEAYGDHLFNVAHVFRRDGTIARQRKLHITPAEAKWWGVQGGSNLSPIQTDCGPIGVLICYDVEFPELPRMLAERGVGLLFVPYNTENRPGHLRVKHTAMARCIENHMFVVTAGCTGNLPMVQNADVHYAQSGFYTPSDISFARDGIAQEATPNMETILFHDVDLHALRRHKRQGTVRNWLDRRQDLYKVTWMGSDEPEEAGTPLPPELKE